MANFSVLEATIRAGVASDESFAIASSVNGDRFVELKYNTPILEVYPSDYLVKVLNALKQLNQERDNPSGGKLDDKPNGGIPGSGNNPVVDPPITPVAEDKDTRFYMSVKLDNTRVIRDLQKYLDEVISHISAVDNCEMELTLEVSAHAQDGFPQGTIRTVSENCRTLHVGSFGFDK